MEKQYKYDAFISYRHVEPDQTIAKEIHRMIESFKPPKEFYKSGKKTNFRVFRDREELAARDLSTSIEEALKESHFLIVLCSKRTPLSEWCEKEIRTFRALHGDSRIIPVLLEGEPDESFPMPLKQLKKGEDESLLDVLAADIRPEEVLKKDFPGYEAVQKTDKGRLTNLTKQAGKLLKVEKYRIMAAILGCSFGDLKQRDKERKNRLILTISSMLGAIFLIFALFMTNAYQKAEQARQEAVQSNASILLKTAKDTAKDGDYLKAVLIAKEAMQSIHEKMPRYKKLRGEELSVFHDAIYHSGASTLTSIFTKNKLTYMTLSYNEKYLAYGLDNDMTAIASVENGEVLKILSGHTQQVKLPLFSHNDKMLATSSFDSSCIIYDVETGESLAKLEIPGIPMLSKFSDDDSELFYVAFRDNFADFYVFDTTKWEEKSKFTIAEPIKNADIRGDGKEVLIVLSANVEEQLSRRRMQDGSIIDVLPKEKAQDMNGQEYSLSYRSAAYSGDKESILVLTDANLKKLSLTDYTELFKQDIKINSNDLKPLIEGENGESIALQSYSKIYLLDGKSGEITDEIYFSELDTKYFTYNSKTNTVVGFGADGRYSIWRNKVIVEDMLSYGGAIPSEFKFLQDGSKLIANSHDSQTIKIIDMNSRISAEPIYARIVSHSNDFSKMLLFDGSEFSISSDNGKSSKKVTVEDNLNYGLMKDGNNYQISNDGRYLTSVWQKADSVKPFLALYDLEEQERQELEVNSTAPLFRFSNDGKALYLLDASEGLKVYSTEDFKEIASYPDIKDSAIDFLLSEDGELLLVNRFSGTASLYNLSSGEEVASIPGQVLHLKREGEAIILKGIQNNSRFIWSNKADIKTAALDDSCAQTPLSFDDINIYNESSGLLLLIRNNEMERKAYVVDFESGQLKMSFTPSVKRYNVNGYISPDGTVIAIDQNYYAKIYGDDSVEHDYMSSAVYHILSEKEVEKEVEKILAGRVLTDEEKEQIGIATK